MFDLTPVSFAEIKPRRKAYLTTTTVPLDGMWEDAFFSGAAHKAILANDEMVGYCAVNADNALLGFQVFDPGLSRDAFAHCLQALEIKQAFVSTAEPLYLSLCLDHQTSTALNAMMFEDTGDQSAPVKFPDGAEFRMIDQANFDAAVEFGCRAIGDMRDWLEGYYAERIAKEELFGLWAGTELLAAGELRISPSQDGVADVGMVVAPDARQKGLATLVLKQLRHDGRQRALRLVCSTECDNIGAQKAIIRAGFESSHRILQIGF